MDSHLENELTLHIEFRDDWRKIDEGQFDEKSQKDLSKFIITERPDGYVQYERDIDIDGGPVGSDIIREIDHLQIRRASFRIEIHPRLGSNKTGGNYCVFTLGRNYQDVNDSKETLKYRGFYYFQFDDGFESLYIVPGVRKLLRQKGIVQETHKTDWSQTQIFFNSFSVQAIRGVFAKFNRMYEIAIELQIQLNGVYSSFAKVVSWKRKGDVKIYPGRLKKGIFK